MWSSGTQASNSVISTITLVVSSDINTRLWTGTTPPDVRVRFRESCWEWNVFSPPPGAPDTVHILHVASYVLWSPTPTRTMLYKTALWKRKAERVTRGKIYHVWRTANECGRPWTWDNKRGYFLFGCPNSFETPRYKVNNDSALMDGHTLTYIAKC